MFISNDASIGDMHLQAGSPAIDHGITTTIMADFDGVLRPQGTAFDLGAFEYK